MFFFQHFVVKRENTNKFLGIRTQETFHQGQMKEQFFQGFSPTILDKEFGIIK